MMTITWDEGENDIKTIGVEDSIVQKVIIKFAKRAEFGKNKYGTDLDRKDLSFKQWLEHLREEHMDSILYASRLYEEYKDSEINNKD